ncbi:MAG: zinc ABC transporter solute-binding protein, partial [Tissierellia bacterium]|nr:zinc ABC transporter solute-binding protein [Tissierellia bacterium]
ILVSHAAFDYMAERYGFHQIPVMGINPEQEPSPKAIADIIETATEGDYRYIFTEPLISPKTVEVIAREAGLKILVLNPIGGLTKEEEAAGEDYISIMKENLKNLEKALVN